MELNIVLKDKNFIDFYNVQDIALIQGNISILLNLLNQKKFQDDMENTWTSLIKLNEKNDFTSLADCLSFKKNYLTQLRSFYDLFFKNRKNIENDYYENNKIIVKNQNGELMVEFDDDIYTLTLLDEINEILVKLIGADAEQESIETTQEPSQDFQNQLPLTNKQLKELAHLEDNADKCVENFNNFRLMFSKIVSNLINKNTDIAFLDVEYYKRETEILKNSNEIERLLSNLRKIETKNKQNLLKFKEFVKDGTIEEAQSFIDNSNYLASQIDIDRVILEKLNVNFNNFIPAKVVYEKYNKMLVSADGVLAIINSLKNTRKGIKSLKVELNCILAIEKGFEAVYNTIKGVIDTVDRNALSEATFIIPFILDNEEKYFESTIDSGEIQNILNNSMANFKKDRIQEKERINNDLESNLLNYRKLVNVFLETMNNICNDNCNLQQIEDMLTTTQDAIIQIGYIFKEINKSYEQKLNVINDLVSLKINK